MLYFYTILYVNIYFTNDSFLQKIKFEFKLRNIMNFKAKFNVAIVTAQLTILCQLCNLHYRVLVGKSEGKRPLGRPRRRWEDNIKMDLQKVGGGYGDWMELAQDRDKWLALVSTVMNIRVPNMGGNFLTSCRTS